MASRRASLVAGAVGVSAGLSAYVPSFVCSGLPCSSCYACVGAGGAAASALLVGFVSRKLRRREEAGDDRAVDRGGSTSVD